MDDDSKQAWVKVGLHFAAAGDKLRDHARQAKSQVDGSGKSGDGGPDQAAVADALNTLGQAVSQVVSSVGSAVKDPEVRENLTDALNSMGDALNVTFADVGDKVGDKIKHTFPKKGS